MASITGRTTASGETRYRVDIRRKGADRIIKFFRDEKTAKTFAAKIESDYEIAGVLPDMASHKRTLAAVINLYRKDVGDLDPTAEQHLDWWSEHYGHITLKRLQRRAIKAALNKLKAKGPKGRPLSGATVNRYHSS